MTAIQTHSTISPTAAAFWSAAEADDQPISYDRCVDWLLDLRQSTDDPGLQALIGEVLAELQELAPFVDELSDLVLGAIASVEVALEIAA